MTSKPDSDSVSGSKPTNKKDTQSEHMQSAKGTKSPSDAQDSLTKKIKRGRPA